MLDSTELRKEINRSGYKLKYIAERLDLSYFGLKRKIDNKTEFRPSEILAMQDLLGLTDKKRDEIFLIKE